ncbi:ABC transporter transmembrane domain-containing protein [Janthinobacterium fluminis]|uniref:ABC transporter ATP-binding protein n=1 Tax=Janthinobacterium fluminis TaxID=2987524 RepID=A0ABT5JU76_9BURK|nr:ABC transporter ATP-binding protein [Janthinobacterium fluminis]MDC8756307.1 ABC transporter ATP-binding protein [Janthinobacterium fluminis]
MRLREKIQESDTGMASSADQHHSSSLNGFMLLLGEYRSKYALATLCAALIGGVGALLHPLLLTAIFDAVTLRADFDRFMYLAGCYFALGVSMNILSFLLSLWQQKLDNRIVEKASEDLLQAYFFKDYGDVMQQGTGYYISRIRSDVKDGLVPMLPLVRKMVVNIVMFVVFISVLIYISLKAFLVLFAIIPVATAVSITVSKKIRGLTNIERDNEASLLDTLTKSVSAFKMVRTFNMASQTIHAFSRKMESVLDSGYKKFRVINGLQRGSDITMVVSDACCIFVGAFFVFRQTMTVGSYIGFMNSFWRSATTLIEIFRQWAELHGHNATVTRLISFMEERPLKLHHKAEGSVLVTDISYCYGANRVISEFSMIVEPGQSVLVAGRNGSGKTTLANILAGYLTPSEGQLKLPVRISAVTLPIQFPPLKVGELGIDSELLQAFKIDALDILEGYPDQLSAGQQQKLSLALSLSHDAELYILDEPLANLDVPSRAIAMQEIQRRTSGRMLVMIMHGGEEYSAIFDKTYNIGSALTQNESLKVVNT